MKSLVARLGGFTASTVVTALVTIASIPLLIRAVGAEAWGDLIVGQAMGTFLAVVAGWGWAVTGPTSVAAMAAPDRPAMFRESLVARGALAVPCLLVAAAIVPLLAHHAPLAATMAATSVVVGSLGGSWYFVGSGDARSLILIDTIPRAAGLLLGAALVAGGAPLVVAPSVQLLGAVTAITLAATRTLRTGSSPDFSFRSFPAVLRAQSAGVVTSAASAVYAALPLLLVSQIAPASTPSFAIADRLLRYGVLAATPMCGLAQSWVPADARRLMDRARIARVAALAFGTAGGLTFLVASTPIASALTGGAVRLPFALTAAYAGVAACVLASQVVGLAVLLPIRRSRALAASTVVGLLLAALLVPAGVLTAGSIGAAGGLVTSELVVLIVQLGATLTPLRGRGPASPNHLATAVALGQ